MAEMILLPRLLCWAVDIVRLLLRKSTDLVVVKLGAVSSSMQMTVKGDTETFAGRPELKDFVAFGFVNLAAFQQFIRIRQRL